MSELHQITPRQREQLRGLYDAGATTRASAVPIVLLRPGAASVLAILQRFGLVAERVGVGARSVALYWLTPEGVAEVRKPSEVHHG